jgi:hypothetical protein
MTPKGLDRIPKAFDTTRRPSRRGSTLVEGAIVLLVFVVVFVGILDMGQVLFFHQFLNDRVRAGARYAVVHSYNTTAIQNVVSYNSPNVPNGGSPLFGLSPSMVQVNHYDIGTPTERVKVSISTYTMHFLSPWLMASFTPGPFTAVMPIESAGSAP